MIIKNVYNANEFYQEGLKLLKSAPEVSPRGMKSKELLGVSFRINNPRDRIITDVNRKFPIKGAMAEFLWYMTQNSKIEYITPYLKHWAKFSDDGIHVNSNYGFRWGDQVKNIIEKIKKDPFTRQGVVTLYDPSFSSYYGKDNVCTPDFQFINRDGLLHLVVNARSRDFIRGECIDQFTFSLLQETVANELGLDLGFYQVNIGSFHVYEEHYNLLDFSPNFNDTLKSELSKTNKTKMPYLQFWENLLQYKLADSDFIGEIVKNKDIKIEEFKKAYESNTFNS